jgi:hypothetical protein
VRFVEKQAIFLAFLPLFLFGKPVATTGLFTISLGDRQRIGLL